MKQKPIKPVKAWAIVRRGRLRKEPGDRFDGTKPSVWLFASMKPASDWCCGGDTAIEVLITPITKKARRK